MPEKRDREVGATLNCPRITVMAQIVKSLPAMWETWIPSLGWEHPLEKEMEPTPVFLPGESHGLVGYIQSMGS